MTTESFSQPDWHLKINGRNMTDTLRPFVTGLTYSDSLDPESDDLEIALADPDDRWRGEWAPVPGLKLELSIGYANQPLFNCGNFELDEISCSLPDNTVRLKALSTQISAALRSRKNKAFDIGTLSGVVGHIAGLHGYFVIGPCEDIPLGRVTQTEESDLAFLKRLSVDYDHIFTILGQNLLFRSRGLLKDSAPLRLKSEHLLSLSFQTQVSHLYSACRVSWRDLATDLSITELIPAEDEITDKTFVPNILNLSLETESVSRARAKARAALRRANRKHRSCQAEMIGQPNCVSGAFVEIQDQGVFNGSYLITSASHTLTRSDGYRTSLELSLN